MVYALKCLGRCEKEKDNETASEGRAKWTVLAYVCGTDLETEGGYATYNVAYMAECIPATATEPGVFRWDDMDKIKERILEMKSKCRWCIVVAHGGEEFAAMPS
ncbi:capsule synthesis protein PGA_cap [Butyrivibrio sp. ob235]|uniref:hypothetical protein n=1 Tax=Butyrivibrio sp. ob235 TaxID=1761780 RepID=UPI0008B4A0C2|nr:hypothetical protein [Butyrivibrio sp. ob235]SEK62905.1 capsule synthesis protein PGA_cap [Butyrivibrio sp. ob235]